MKLKYKCAICGAEYQLNGFTNHIQRTHKMKYKDYYDTYIDVSKNHKCKFCDNECIFTNYTGYKLICHNPTCARKLQHETMYERYGKSCRHADKIKEKPVIDYPLVCQLCNRGFKSKSVLNRHIIKEHKEITTEEYYIRYFNVIPKNCEFCNKRAKWLGIKYAPTCGSAECVSKLRSSNNAMNNPKYRKKISDIQISFSDEKKTIIKEKRKKTCLEKYGYEHNWSSPELRENGYKTCEEKYGDRYYHNIEKMQKTCEEHFGVRSFSQTEAFQEKKWHKYIKDGKTYDSSYEYAFCNFLNIFNIPYEYHSKDKFRYEFNGEEYFYFPDFKINGVFYEIKSEYLFKCMQIPNTKENAKYQCMLKNAVKIIPSCEVLDFINTVFDKDFSVDGIVETCLNSAFPGTNKWPANHPIWDCFIPGYKTPKDAWHDKTLIIRAVINMLKYVKKYLIEGTEQAFCARCLKALVNNNYFSDILKRFTIAKIAPKVTALDENDLLKIINEAGLNMNNGIYCPMAGFGGIVRAAERWSKDHNLPINIEAYDINENFCKWYGWKQRDVLAQVIHTDKTVVVCPPFGKKYEHWKGTPDEMSDIEFLDWVKLIKEHVIAPNYIFIGPELDGGKNKCGLFKRKLGISLYKEENV